MMRYGQILIGPCLAFSVTACSTLPDRYQLAAPELMPVPPDDPKNPDHPSSLDKVHALVQDSQTKCARFVNSMFVEQAGTGFGLDIASTASSALATVFSPLAVVHSLTAASTIFGGARTSLSAEYLNSLTISHISQAIQSTYTVAMAKYINDLPKDETSTINPYVERSTILSIHNACSLAAAEGTIGSTLQPSGIGQTPASITYPVANTDTTLGKIAAGVAARINGDTDFATAGVSASADANGVVYLKMTSPLRPRCHCV